MKRFIIILTLLFVMFLGASVPSFFWWRSYVHHKRDTQSFNEASQLVEANEAEEALRIIHGQRTKNVDDPDEKQKWVNVEIDACESLKHVPRLVWLHDTHQRDLQQHEEACLLVARAKVESRDIDAYEELREEWRGKATMEHAWFCLDADALLSQRENDDALRLLKSRTFDGDKDCGRLARLAMLAVPTDRKKAWEYLSQAYEKNPRNPDIRMFRGHFLEAVGKVDEARIEYVAAHVANPDNPFYMDRLAEFYRRHGRFQMALETWHRAISQGDLDIVWPKSLFWQSVAQPATDSLASYPSPDGRMFDFVEFMRSVPNDKFWDIEAFRAVSNEQKLREKRQDIFWLSLLQRLQDGDEKEALSMLVNNRLRFGSWHAELETRLAQVLSFRSTDSLSAEIPVPPNKLSDDRHQLFQLLQKMDDDVAVSKRTKLPADVKRLLKSDNAFSAVLLAAGWREAALKLRVPNEDTSSFPAWFGYGITQSLRLNRGNDSALAYAKKQKSSPEMSLLIGELQLAMGNSAVGLKTLQSLRKREDGIGYRATFLIVGACLDRGNSSLARQAALANRTFAASKRGQEIIASTWLVEGDVRQANGVYARLDTESEARMAHDARQAFAKKDYKQARRITQKLIEKMPTEMQLHANLAAISDAEGK